jgi:hypothetical protein
MSISGINAVLRRGADGRGFPPRGGSAEFGAQALIQPENRHPERLEGPESICNVVTLAR